GRTASRKWQIAWGRASSRAASLTHAIPGYFRRCFSYATQDSARVCCGRGREARCLRRQCPFHSVERVIGGGRRDSARITAQREALPWEGVGSRSGHLRSAAARRERKLSTS